MNARIKSLAKKATKTTTRSGAFGLTQSESEIDLEKFAELIVRDCANFVYKAQPDTLALDLLSHYGIIE